MIGAAGPGGARLVVGSLYEQLPPVIALVDLAPPRPTLAVNAVCPTMSATRRSVASSTPLHR
jgi:hypothetical protein